MKVKITAHKGFLVISSDSSVDAGEDWVPAGPGQIGCVLVDTKKHLGVSREALDLLKSVKRSHDDIGDVDWFACDDGRKAFSWIGGEKSLKKASQIEGSQAYGVFGQDCTIIENKVPLEIAAAIEIHIKNSEVREAVK